MEQTKKSRQILAKVNDIAKVFDTIINDSKKSDVIVKQDKRINNDY